MTLIDTSRINIGGGKVLLLYLINKLENKNNVIFLLDDRLDEAALFNKNNHKKYKSKGASYFFIEKFKLIFKKDSIYFSFINIPSILMATFKVKQIVYIHNSYVFESKNLKFKVLRILFRISIFLDKKIKFYVQTNTMKAKFIKTFKYYNVEVMPFYNLQIIEIYKDKHKENNIIYDFIYVGLPSNHKNHDILIEALKLLPKDVFITIAMTIPEYETALLNKIKDLNTNVQIINLGLLSYKSTLENFSLSRCLIFPSLKESFGLPLIEAQIIGLDILASNLEYVYDVIDPTDTFNPYEANDIKRSILNYLMNNKRIKVTLKSTNKIEEIEKEILNRSNNT